MASVPPLFTRPVVKRGVTAALTGTIADVGCGPRHFTRFLSAHHADLIGIDLSPAMIAIARHRAPELIFTVGSMLRLPTSDGAWVGAVALYSIIHLTAEERATAFRELARAVRPGGWLLVAFHVDSQDFATGQINHLVSWFGQRVELDGYFLDPSEVVAQLEGAGFTLIANLQRQPTPEEYTSRRCYLLAQHRCSPSPRGPPPSSPGSGECCSLDDPLAGRVGRSTRHG